MWWEGAEKVKRNDSNRGGRRWSEEEEEEIEDENKDENEVMEEIDWVDSEAWGED